MTSSAQVLSSAPDRWNDGDGNRLYRSKSTGEQFYSVTTQLKVISKPYLVPWAAKMTWDATLRDLPEIVGMVNAGQAEAAGKRVKAAWKEYRDDKANIGTAVHAAMEADTLGQPWPAWSPEILPYMVQAMDWRNTWQPEWIAAELTVFNRTHGYAGSFDGVARFPALGLTLMLDFKSGNYVSPNDALQLAAYRYGEWAELNTGQVVQVPPVDGAAIVHITSKKWEFLPVKAGPAEFEFYTEATRLFEWVNNASNEAIGKPYALAVRAR